MLAPAPVSMPFNLLATAATDSFSAHKTLDLSGLQDNKGGLTIKANTQVTFKAAENRSTGYQWEVAENTCGAKFVQSTDLYNKNGNDSKLGSGGERVWTFDSLTPDANYIRGLPCSLTFIYKRPWLKTADSAVDIKQVTVTVN